MRALPLRAASASPMRFTRASRLPTPQVQKALVRQVVNLRPQGNTITVTTREQNPFSVSRPISVQTQLSGGMARPDPQMQSRALLHEYIPGLGADTAPAATPIKQPGALDFLTTAAGTAADLYAQRQTTMAAQAQANAAIAQARSDALRAQLSNPFAAMQQRSSITIPLLIVAGGAALVAGVLILRKRKARR